MYRACHLASPEVIWIARGRDFAETVYRLAPHSIAPVAWLLPAPFVLPLIVLIIVSDGLLERLEAPPAADPAAFAVAPLICLALLFSNWLFFSATSGARSYWPGIMVGYLLLGLFGIGAVVLSVGPSPLITLGAVLGVTVASVVHMTVAMTRGVRRRAALRSRLKISIPLTGAVPLAEVVAARLRLAAEQVATTGGAPRPVRPVHRADREEASERLFAELRRRADYRTHRLRPVVGALARLSDRSPLERALREGASPEELPELLRTALSVHGNADAVCTFEGIAVSFCRSTLHSRRCRFGRRRVGAPDPGLRGRPTMRSSGCWTSHSGSASPSTSRSRIGSRTASWRERSGGARAARCATSLVRTLRIGPAHADETGSLFVFGPASDPLTYVRVIDATPHPDGRPKVHWLCVPPHAATAREAVAWTFGLAGRDYHPTVESRGRIVPLGSKVVLRCL